LSLYTWNLRTGYLDSIATYTGLEIVGWTLLPGKWLKAKSGDLWTNYVYLVDTRRENETLHQRLELMSSTLARSKEEAAEVKRLRTMLSFSPPPAWTMLGARVVAFHLGPHAALETLVVDKGEAAGIGLNTPVTTPRGVLGRILRTGPFFSTVLLMTDLNSKFGVIGQKHRTPGVISGKGIDNPLEVLYVPLNSPIDKEEILITSGLDGIFPKGLPVAQVTHIERSESSLFLVVKAKPLIDVKKVEEVMLLKCNDAIGGAGASLEYLQ
jgi:rod shape-determining protein MreC